ncbi:MAG: PAS domain S-box protein [Ferruginibacter sp.]
MSKEYQTNVDVLTKRSSGLIAVPSLKKRPAILGLLTFVILTSLAGILIYQRILIKRENRQVITQKYIVEVKERLQNLLAQSLAATKTLSLFIESDSSIKNFDSIAALILNSNPDIDALQSVPGGIIKEIYPLKGNEAAIGFDILHDSSRNKEAYKAIKKNELFFAGPLELRQGGIGVVGRLPVFRENKFWGFSVVVIRLSTLLKAAGVDTTGASGFYFQLSKINPDTKKEEIFVTHPKVKKADLISGNVPYGEWILSATPAGNAIGDGDIFWLAFLGFLLSVIMGAFIYMIAVRPERLSNLVKERTEALADSEERYRSLIEQASDGIIVYSFDGAIHQFNKTAYLESGYTKEEFAKLNLKDLLPEKKMTIREAKVVAIQPGKTAMLERQLKRKDGSLIDIEIHVNMLPDTTLLAVVRNTTERKNAEKALKESEKKFSRVFQSDLIGLAISDENNIIDANEYFADVIELPIDTIIGKMPVQAALLTKINECNKSYYQDQVETLLNENGRLKNHEVEINRSNGCTVCLLISIEPLELNDKPHWLTTVIDITEKKSAELSLETSERKYRSLIEQASDGIVITDFEGRIVEVNNSICDLTGYSCDELVGSHIESFLPQENMAKIPLRIPDLLEGKSLLYERQLQKRNGEIIDVEINSKMANEHTLIGFVRDITARKIVEQELSVSNDRFELIAQATNDAIWNLDFMMDEITGNDNLYRLYGFTKGIDKITQADFAERVHPDDLPRLREYYKKIAGEKGITVMEEFRFRIADGTYKTLYNRSYIKYNNDGLPAQMMGVLQDMTDRVNSEQAIKKEKELSDSIINSLPAVFYLYNEKREFKRWNKNFETVSGYSASEIKTMHSQQFHDERERALLDTKINLVFEVGYGNVEALFVTKDKQKIPYYFSGVRIQYEGENCLVGFGVDFTEKVKAQQAIKDSEAKFRSLIEQAAEGVQIISPEGTIRYTSPSVKRITGYTEEEIINMRAFSLIDADDLDEIQQQIAKAIANPGVPLKGKEYRVLHKDGTNRWIESTLTNMIHNVHVNGIVVNFRDVTEKLEIEKNIIAEKELSDSIINSLPGIFYLYDETGEFIRWNKNLETVSGYSAEEIKHMHPVDFYDEPEKPLIKQRIKDLLRKKILVPGAEFRLFTKDKQHIPFLYNSKVTEYKGKPCIMGMGFDVTDRKKIEQELIISNQKLEKKAAELVSSYSELERFAYIVSHDLQEPLRMVSSFLKLLEKKYKGTLDETGEKYIHFAVDGADRMKQLIMDLLEYSRTGTNKDVAVDTDMNVVMKEVLEVLKNPITETEAVVQFDHLPVLPQTSKVQMFQLMQNLVGNALKYRGTEKPLIKIKAEEQADHWLFSVEDNGIGIDPKFSDKIFIIFQRLHAKNEFSGTGVGLSICKKIVEKHGGKIWVESIGSNGSTFYFTIAKKVY